MKTRIKLIGFALLMIVATTGYAQKGVGEKKGMCNQGINAEVVELKGEVTSLEEGPCEYTSGRSLSGTHLFIKTADKKTLNIHLGPTVEVSKFVTDVKGKSIIVKGFRTEMLPAEHYIAKQLIINDKLTVLRDEKLKPFWAGRTGRERWCCKQSR
ncbi:hypothetical protein [Spongiivirga citrea]|uniref:Magnetosome protein MamS/MamX domain-containing protein n=1 Tax=Spongiivirga citrea TaxID=1481457 RepID=A0A6M0CMY9_9FLAO|nr:hypothetical protein [Spongiivirga citrea]NER17414.1 hypothetical protein [Spongiivirga citrea]